MSKTRELQYWKRKLDKAETAVDVACGKFYERIAMFAHENAPSGRSVKRWADSYEWKQLLCRDIEIAINALENKWDQPGFATPVIADEFYARNG